MIRTTVGVLVAAEEALEKLSKLDLSVRAAWCLAKLIEIVAVETARFKQQRTRWIRELGEERPPTDAEIAQGARGPSIHVTDANWPTFLERIDELASVTVELAVEPFDLSQVGDGAIRGRDVLMLGPVARWDDKTADSTGDLKAPVEPATIPSSTPTA